MSKSFAIIEILVGLGLIAFIYLSLLGSGFFNTYRGRGIGLWSLLPGVLLLIAGIAGLAGHKFRKIQVVAMEVFILGFILYPLDSYNSYFLYYLLFGHPLRFLTVPLFFLIAGYVNSSLLSTDFRSKSLVKIWFLTLLIFPLTLVWLDELSILNVYAYILPGYGLPHFIGGGFHTLELIELFPLCFVLIPLGIYLQRITTSKL